MTAGAPRSVRRWCPEELELGEGVRWVDASEGPGPGRVVLVDILGGALYEAPGEPGPLVELASVGDLPLGAVAPVAGEPGTWLAAVGRGIAYLSGHGAIDWVDQPEPQQHRMNDAVCDPSGRFWAGSTSLERVPGAGSLYRVDHDGAVRRVLDGLTIPNGPAFSRDGATMYLADSAEHVLRAYPVELDSGDLGEPRQLLAADEGSPDGVTVDAEGAVWVALNGAGRAVRLDPADGSVLDAVHLPVPQVTSVCLTDRRLFVATAHEGQGPDHLDGAGSLYAVEVDVPGRPAASYGRSGAG